MEQRFDFRLPTSFKLSKPTDDEFFRFANNSIIRFQDDKYVFIYTKDLSNIASGTFTQSDGKLIIKHNDIEYVYEIIDDRQGLEKISRNGDTISFL